MGRFYRKLAATQGAHRLAYNELSLSNQTNVDLIESQQGRLERGEKIVGEELLNVGQAQVQVSQAATDMQPDAFRKVGQAL